MPVVIKLAFPAGRYHATPWGRHVNEGVPEWPPSPWRLLRALVAVWKRTCPNLTEEQLGRILEPLTHPPRFQLPPHRVAHTRHYMPWEKKGPTDRALVFDTFVSVSRQESLFIGWPESELTADDRATLSKLLENLSTLGRAEAWVHAELSNGPVDLPLGPAELNDSNPMPVFCPDPATAFRNDYYPTLDPKKLATGKLNPANFLFDCPRWHLCLDTETIHNEKWPTVPGAKWVNYTRPTEAPSVRVAATRADRRKPTIARFLLDGPVLPLITDPIRIAEAFRRAAMSQFKWWCERNPKLADQFRRPDAPEQFVSRTFSGKELSGEVLKNHRHAFYLPTAEGDDPRRITHVTMTATDGFGSAEVAALNAIRKLKLRDESELLHVQLVGLGTERDFRAPLLGKSTGWTSATPFVVTRYPKLRGRNRDAAEVIASKEAFGRHILWQEVDRLRQRRPDLPQVVDIFPVDVINGNLRPFDFKRFREKRGDDGGRRLSGAFRIVFAEPVEGPLCFGHSSHFGLGLFVPADV